MDPSTFFSTFGMDQLAKICQHCYQERLKTSRGAESESDILTNNEDILTLQST